MNKKQFHPLPDDLLNSIRTKYLDVPYAAESPMQILDVYLPNEKKEGRYPYPVIFHTHGGAFANGDQREDNVIPMLRGLERGYAVVSIQYRRSREAFFPAQVYDAKAALRFIRANAERWHLDPDRVVAWGPSSGGWLASMLGVTAGNPAFEDLSQGNALCSSQVQAVIDWCGPCGGFLEMDRAFRKSGLGEATHDQPDSPESRFLGRPITEIPELVRLACPCTYVHKDMPPFYIVHGSADQVVPVEQSMTFYEEIVKTAGAERAELLVVEGKPHHGAPWYNEQWLSDKCLDFTDRALGM